MPVLAFELTLEAQLHDYDEADTKAGLASLYNVSADAISITLEAASLKLAIAIVPADRSAGGVAALRGTIESRSAAQVSALLGSDAAVTSSVRTEEAEEQYEATCPRGHWCSAGLDPNPYPNPNPNPNPNPSPNPSPNTDQVLCWAGDAVWRGHVQRRAQPGQPRRVHALPCG